MTPQQRIALNNYITTIYDLQQNKYNKSGAKWGYLKQCGGV